MNTIYELAEEMRDSIGEFCLNDCKGECCRLGKLPLYSKEEVLIISSKLRNKSLHYIHTDTSGMMSFDLEHCRCPYLGKRNECKIHSQKRPYMCVQFPVFIKDGFVIVASDCKATVNRQFDRFYPKIKELGYTVLIR